MSQHRLVPLKTNKCQILITLRWLYLTSCFLEGQHLTSVKKMFVAMPTLVKGFKIHHQEGRKKPMNVNTGKTRDKLN